MRVSSATVLLLRSLERRQLSDAEDVCAAVCDGREGYMDSPECTTTTAAGFSDECLALVCETLMEADMQPCVTCREAALPAFGNWRGQCTVAFPSSASVLSVFGTATSSSSATGTSSDDESSTSSRTSTSLLTRFSLSSSADDDLETGTASPSPSASATSSRTLEEHEMKTIPRYSPTTLVRPSETSSASTSGSAAPHDDSASSRSAPGAALLAAAAALAALV